jgi:hypothetical protein
MAFIQAPESESFDASIVDEKILTIILLDKTIALFFAEPFYGSLCHSAPSFCKIFKPVRMNALAKKKTMNPPPEL